MQRRPMHEESASIHVPSNVMKNPRQSAPRPRSERIRADPRPVDPSGSASPAAREAMPKPRNTITFDAVRRLGFALPDVEEATAYGSPALKVRGKMFTCIAINKSAEPNSLVVRMDFAQRDELIAAEPDTYYLTDHYVNYPCVLVRLSRVHPDALRDLLRMARDFVSNRNKKPARTRRRKQSG